MKKVLLAVVLVSGCCFADNSNSFVEGFAKGLNNALAARQGYYPQPQQPQIYGQQDLIAAQMEQLRLLREQVEIQRQQLQQAQSEAIMRQRDSK